MYKGSATIIISCVTEIRALATDYSALIDWALIRRLPIGRGMWDRRMGKG